MFKLPPTRFDFVVAYRERPHTSRVFVGDKKLALTQQKNRLVYDGIKLILSVPEFQPRQVESG